MAWIEEQVDARVAELRVALLVRLDRTDKFPFDDDFVDLDVLVLAGQLLLHPSQIEGGPPSGAIRARQDRRQGRRIGVGRRAEDDPSATEFHRRSVPWRWPRAVPRHPQAPRQTRRKPFGGATRRMGRLTNRPLAVMIPRSAEANRR